jgi:hypothetical protein
MIIGAILETGDNQGAGSSRQNGAAMVVFYTMNDAIVWAQTQSVGTPFETNTVYALCSVVNTDTGVKRWWYNGTEYTG